MSEIVAETPGAEQDDDDSRAALDSSLGTETHFGYARDTFESQRLLLVERPRRM